MKWARLVADAWRQVVAQALESAIEAGTVGE